MTNRDAGIRFRLLTDQQDKQRAIQDVGEVRRALAEASDENRDLARTADDAAGELRKMGRADGDIGEISKAARDAAGDVDDLRRSVDGVGDALRRGQGDVRAYNAEFDRVSRDVGLAGDVQSNLGAIGGLASAAGAGGVGSGIAVGGEVAALIEELPRLKTALAGLPSTIGSAVGALGPLGLVALPVAAAAAFGLAGALEAQARAAEEARDRTKAGVGVLQEFYDNIATGTTGDIQAEIERLQAENAVLQQTRDKLSKDTRVAFDQATGGFGTAVQTIVQTTRELEAAAADGEITTERYAQAIADATGIAFGDALTFAEEAAAVYGDGRLDIETLNAVVADLGTEINANENLINLYTQALEEQATAAADAAAAEQALADERRNALLDAAAGELRRAQLEQQLANQSAESLQNRLDAIEAERAGLQEAIATLRESGDTSEQVAAQIDAYTSQLNALEQEQSIINSGILGQVQAQEAAAAAAGELAAAQEEEAAVKQEVREATREYTAAVGESFRQLAADRAALDDRLTELEQETAEKRRGILEDSRDALAEAATEAESARADALKEANSATLDAEQERADALADVEQGLADRRLEINRRFSASLTNAIGERDALAAFLARQQQQDELRNAEEQAGRERSQTEEAYNRQLAEVQTAYDEQLTEISTAYDEQTATIRAKTDEQLAALTAAYDEQVAVEREKLQEIIANRRAALEEELAAVQAQREALRELQSGDDQQQAGGLAGVVNNLSSNFSPDFNFNLQAMNRGQLIRGVTDALDEAIRIAVPEMD